MSRFYDRRFEILVNDEKFIEAKEGKQFKVVFNVLVDFGGYHSYADISIYNLSSSTSSNILKKGSVLGLRAGYVDAIDYIFKGVIKNAFNERQGPNTITRVIALGGTTSNKVVNKSFGTNAKLPALLRECASALELPLVMNEDDFSNVTPYSKGYLLTGDPEKILKKLSLTHDFKYVIENQRIVIVGKDSSRVGTPYLVSQSNGLEGIPEVTEIGVDANVRLTPKIKIGGQIDVQSKLSSFNFSNLYFQNIPSKAGTGIYNVLRLSYAGDTHGDTWTTTVNAIRPVTKS